METAIELAGLSGEDRAQPALGGPGTQLQAGILQGF